MAVDYAKLDAAILERLPTNFNCLRAALGEQANEYAKPDRFGGRQGWRVIDRRLQALRKQGLIRFVKGLWHRQVTITNPKDRDSRVPGKRAFPAL